MASDQSLALVENILRLDANIVALLNELRLLRRAIRNGKSQVSRLSVVKWASLELRSPEFVGADTPESTESLTATERRSILKALVQTNGNKIDAARVLGIGKTTLYRKLQAYKQGEVSRHKHAEMSPNVR